ncbi:glycosyltransferase family 2 protein, partial [Endozoicomonas arenosclerae]|uniref:glycosyltransferase family 2 protein n=1 Tax=Endozoicomonas arenosclerae TaxID=1633495 RepID=UPI000782A9B0
IEDTDSIKTQSVVSLFNCEKIKFVRNRHKGASSSRNLGANLAESDYVAFLDDDDLWVPEKLEKQVALVEKNDLDVCYTRMFIQYENTSIKYTTRTLNRKSPLINILMENYLGGTPSALIKRSSMMLVSGFDEHFPAREEYDLWIRLIKSGCKIGVVEEPLVVANRSLEKRSRISANIDNYVNAINLLNEKHKQLVIDTLTNAQIRKRKSLQYEFLAAQAVSINLRWISARYYLMSALNLFSVKPVLLSMISFLSPKLLIRLRSTLKS